jgi:deoxyribodipyrimidine photo-lyase
MEKPKMQIVWIKRDLRTRDHAPLAEAEASGLPYRVIFIFEPSLVAHPDCSERHLRFQWQSLIDMNRTWLRLMQDSEARQVDVFWGEAEAVFSALLDAYEITRVLSYEESGIEKSFLRDKAIAQLLKSKGVIWREFQRNGVLRGIKDRVDWDKRWFATMYEPVKKHSRPAKAKSRSNKKMEGGGSE